MRLIFQNAYRHCDTILWLSIVFNLIGLSFLFQDSPLNAAHHFLPIHYGVSIILTIMVSIHVRHSKNHQSLVKNKQFRPYFHAFSAWPIITLFIFIKSISIAHAIVYSFFLASSILFTQNALWLIPWASIKKQLLFASIFSLFFWGLFFILEPFPTINAIIAPLTLTYHLFYILEGILHISSITIMIGFPLVLILFRRK